MRNASASTEDARSLSRRRNESIDSLRGLAALSVFFHHSLGDVFFPYLDLGRVGVLLFFVISGYCIFLSVDSLGERPLVPFLIRRVFRLYPVYWISMVLVLAFDDPGVRWDAILANLTMVQKAFGYADLVGVYWTLFVEVLFYGVIVLLIAVGAIRSRAVLLGVFLGILTVLLIGGASRWFGMSLPYGYAGFLATFLLGGLIYRSDANSGGRDRFPWWALVLVQIVAVIFVGVSVFKDGAVGMETAFSYPANYVVAIGFFCLVTRRNCLRVKILGYFGAISYSVYLFHTILIHWFDAVFEVPTAVRLALLFVVVVAFSASMYHAVELPFIAIGKRLSRALSPRRVAVTQ